MNIHIYSSYEEMSEATATFIISQVNSKKDLVICLPSGDTPTATLRRLVEAARNGRVDFSQCKFVGLDEWVGMDKNDPGSCQHYVYQHFFDQIDIPAANIIFFDAKSTDLDGECKKVNDFLLKHGPLDLLLVGVGLNGHIGLNEPGEPSTHRAHVVQLEKSTKEVAKKYFQETKKLEKGITLGLQQVMDAKTVLVIANGKKKSEIIQKILEGPVTEQVPGTILQRHPDYHVFLDEDASSKLTVT
jgi:glucosamine-6-phosphate isomerase